MEKCLGVNQQKNIFEFKIKYQEPVSFTAPKKGKVRYSLLGDTLAMRNYLNNDKNKSREVRSNSKEHERDVSILHSERTKKSSGLALKVHSATDLINEINIGDKNVFERKKNRNFPRIPIEYNDEKVNGVCIGGIKQKVIYKGYAPKNTYFYLKTLATNSRKTFEYSIDFRSRVQIKKNESQLQFNSNFESGNLSTVIKKSQKQFYLYMRQDTNTFGVRQWFYFTVTNNKAGKYKFRIYKFSKAFSLYRNGMKPFFKYGKQQWKQKGEQVKYEFDFDQKCFYLEFQFEFQKDNMMYECATQPPYTYTMLKDSLQIILQKYPKICIKSAGESLAGLDIPKIQIINPLQKKKKAIVILGRTHPSQTASNWTIESFIDRIHEIPVLLEYFDFYLIPMVNPDGVFFGNHRTGVMGQDINRHFNNSQKSYFPEVEIVQRLIQQVQKQKKIAFLFDLHGHSARKNIFAYGDRYSVGSKAFLNLHILPKLLSQQNCAFKYKYCVFRSWKQKKTTARVYLSNKYKLNSITFEQSYGLTDQGAIGITHWRNFGISLANCLKKFYEMVSIGTHTLQEYLGSEITYHKKKQLKKEEEQLKLIKCQTEIRDLIENEKKEKINEKQSVSKQISHSIKMKQQQKSEFKIEQNVEQRSSVNSEQLSSGDQSLENNEQGIQILKRQIGTQGIYIKQMTKRQRYNVAQSVIQINNNYVQKGFEWKYTMIPMIPRILKLQVRRKYQNNYSGSKSKTKINNRINFSVDKKSSVLFPIIQKDRNRKD